MPPKPKYTREEIVKVAFDMTREMGFDAVTTRELGKRLGTSVSPIFTLFQNMHEVRVEVRKMAMKEFERYVADSLNYSPAFKQFGINMIEFAINEPKLFQILYMEEQEESITFGDMIHNLGEPAILCIGIIRKDYDLTEEEAGILFGHVWLYTFSICVLVANKVCCFAKEEISRMLSMEFQGELKLIKSGQYREVTAEVTPKGE